MTVQSGRLKTVAVAVGILFAGAALAPAQQQDRAQHQQDRQAKAGQDKAAKNAKHDFQTCRASEFIGREVRNNAGKDIGEVQDLALDARTGRVAYAVLSFGGFMNMGEDWFAIPVQAFTKGTDGKLVLNIPKEKLENSKGFNKDNWPNMADKKWAAAVHTQYGYPPYWEDENWAKEMKQNRESGNEFRIVQASDVVGFNVKNTQQADVGEIKDLIVDDSKHRVAYAVVSVGGFLGMGDRLVGVPWSKLNVQAEPESTNVKSISISIDKEMLKSAPEFKEDQWSASFDKNYIGSVYSHYHAQPYWSSEAGGRNGVD